MKKKILSFAMAAVMTAAMSISALAAETKIDAAGLAAGAYGNLDNPNSQADEGEKYGPEGQVGVKPKDKAADKDNSGYSVTVNAEKAGKYTVKVAYVSNADTNRGFSYQIDNGTRTDVTCDASGSWKAAEAKVYEIKDVELTAGAHTLKLACPSNFDTVKACNIAYVSYELTEEAKAPAGDDQPTQEAPADKPTQEAPSDNKVPTGDSAAPIVFVALAAVAVAGVAVICRRKTA